MSTHDSVAGATTTANGVGDLFLRAKWNLLGDDGGNISVALFPYVKLPTASHAIGNGAVEEGLIVPIAFNLPNNLQLSIDPEADALADATGSGRHLNIATPISLSYGVTKTVTLFSELWGDEDYDPTGATFQASFDLGAAWIPAKLPTFQLDGGVNLGLNQSTPSVQAYVGVSKRF